MPSSMIHEVEVQTEISRQRERRMQSRFLKGPIPMNDLSAASRLPGQALALYLAVRHRCDISRSAAVTLPAPLLRQLGINKDGKSRAIRALSAAGLIMVEQRRGRSARVTLASNSSK